MDEKSITIILQNVFGSYANRILSGIHLIQKSMKENYQLILKFSNNHSVVWSKFLEENKSDITKKSVIYSIYKPKFPSKKIKFVKTSSQNTLTRTITILDIEEKEKESNASLSMAYVDVKEDTPNISLELTSVHKIVSEHMILHGWDTSKCNYTYAQDIHDRRLINGPIDRTDVECVYVGNPKHTRENLFKLLALIDESYDYKNILLKNSAMQLYRLPSILTNRIMNSFDIKDCKIYETPSTKFYNIISYENLWSPMDTVITQNGKEIFTKNEKADSMTKYYSTIIHQALCTFHDGVYFILDGHVPVEKDDFVQMKCLKGYAEWKDLIDDHDMFAVIHDGKHYYYNKNIVIDYAVNASFKSTCLWKFILPCMSQNYPCTMKIKYRDGKYYETEIVKEIPDKEEEAFNKLCATYSNTFTPLTKDTKFSSIIRLTYQYISENIFSDKPHESIIHIFDTKSIGSVELVKFCKSEKLILVGKRPYVVEYFEKIVKDSDVGILHSNSVITDHIPQIEVINTCKNDFIESLIKETSFINNSIDIIYLQNNFTHFNTFPKIVKLAQNASKILSKRGRVYVNFFNLTKINHMLVKTEATMPFFNLKGVPLEDIQLIDELFEPYIHTVRIGKLVYKDKNILIEKDINNEELDEVYRIRRLMAESYTVIVSKRSVSNHGFFEEYRLGEVYLYVLYPIFENRSMESVVKSVVKEALEKREHVIKTISIDVPYYAINPMLFSVFGECSSVVSPYKTQILSTLISQNPSYLYVINKENESVFGSLQLNIY